MCDHNIPMLHAHTIFFFSAMVLTNQACFFLFFKSSKHTLILFYYVFFIYAFIYLLLRVSRGSELTDCSPKKKKLNAHKHVDLSGSEIIVSSPSTVWSLVYN